MDKKQIYTTLMAEGEGFEPSVHLFKRTAV